MTTGNVMYIDVELVIVIRHNAIWFPLLVAFALLLATFPVLPPVLSFNLMLLNSDQERGEIEHSELLP